jgi:hypothetical protein
MSSRKSGSSVASANVTKLPRKSITLEANMGLVRKLERGNRAQSALTVHSQGIPLVSKTCIITFYCRISGTR